MHMTLNDPRVQQSIDQLLDRRPRFSRLWAYYRNPMRICGAISDDAGSDRPYRQAQEWGLPSRITGSRSSDEPFNAQPVDGVDRKEVVIENDIAWRIDTMVDYLFGKPIVINSAVSDPARRAQIDELLRLIVAHNGGITFLQQLALLGSIHGFVDVLVKLVDESDDDTADSSPSNKPIAAGCSTQDLGQPPACDGQDAFPGAAGAPDGASASSTDAPPPEAEPASRENVSSDPGASDPSHVAALERLARRIRLEIVEPARALPLLSCEDYRVVEAYGQVYEISRETSPPRRAGAQRGIVARLRESLFPRRIWEKSESVRVVELITSRNWKRFEDDRLVAQGENSLGDIPLVHIQNTVVPFEYPGLSDVEPLMPLQDELNTRLSDRAFRITMQSFKMYLGKGIEGFDSQNIAPGRMWMTDNEQADVIEFGGDGKTFSEDNHIADIRQALDKTSGVTPIAAGALKGRIGRLTSAAALRVTMLALLAKTERKRTTYGQGIARMCELALAWLDRAGLFATTPDERRVELHWPSPIPVNEVERLDEAKAKLAIGISPQIVLRELGY
ncbi:MAG TPA: phage portal protein [Tepidisphaeraceae bacterium]|nr:phage portal protein [Tepidisphaeraceae bacterium]